MNVAIWYLSSAAPAAAPPAAAPACSSRRAGRCSGRRAGPAPAAAERAPAVGRVVTKRRSGEAAVDDFVTAT